MLLQDYSTVMPGSRDKVYITLFDPGTHGPHHVIYKTHTLFKQTQTKKILNYVIVLYCTLPCLSSDRNHNHTHTTSNISRALPQSKDVIIRPRLPFIS